MSRVDNLFDQNGDLDITKSRLAGSFFDAGALANSTPYVSNPLRLYLTRAPRAFKYHPQGPLLTQYLKHLIEVGAKNWTGFNQPRTIEQLQVPAGFDKQMLTLPISVDRAPITPAATFDTLYEAACKRFWVYFIDTFYANPDTKRPNFAEFTEVPPDWTADMFTFDIVAVEPNATYTKALFAYAFAGVTLADAPEIAHERNTQQARQGSEYTLTFNGWVDYGDEAVKMGTMLLNAERLNTINPRQKPVWFDQVEAAVAAAPGGVLNQSNEQNAWNG